MYIYILSVEILTLALFDLTTLFLEVVHFKINQSIYLKGMYAESKCGHIKFSEYDSE